MHSRLILLPTGCCRVQEKDERMQLPHIRLQMVAQGLGLLESCSQRCGIQSRRRYRGCDIYTQPDPSVTCETSLFKSRLLFSGAAVYGHLATSL